MKKVVLIFLVFAALAVSTAFTSYNKDDDKNKIKQLPTEAEWEEAARNAKLDTIGKRRVIKGGTWKDVERLILEDKANARSQSKQLPSETEWEAAADNAKVDTISKRRVINGGTWKDAERLILEDKK